MALPLIVRAIITGFGYKIGTEAARWVVDQVTRRKKAKKEAAEAADDLPEGLPSDPANPGNEPPPPVVPPVPEPL